MLSIAPASAGAVILLSFAEGDIGAFVDIDAAAGRGVVVLIQAKGVGASLLSGAPGTAGTVTLSSAVDGTFSVSADTDAARGAAESIRVEVEGVIAAGEEGTVTVGVGMGVESSAGGTQLPPPPLFFAMSSRVELLAFALACFSDVDADAGLVLGRGGVVSPERSDG